MIVDHPRTPHSTQTITLSNSSHPVLPERRLRSLRNCSRWNSALLQGRRSRGPQWDHSTASYHVSRTSKEYLTGVTPIQTEPTSASSSSLPPSNRSYHQSGSSLHLQSSHQNLHPEQTNSRHHAQLPPSQPHIFDTSNQLKRTPSFQGPGGLRPLAPNPAQHGGSYPMNTGMLVPGNNLHAAPSQPFAGVGSSSGLLSSLSDPKHGLFPTSTSLQPSSKYAGHPSAPFGPASVSSASSSVARHQMASPMVSDLEGKSHHTSLSHPDSDPKEPNDLSYGGSRKASVDKRHEGHTQQRPGLASNVANYQGLQISDSYHPPAQSPGSGGPYSPNPLSSSSPVKPISAQQPEISPMANHPTHHPTSSGTSDQQKGSAGSPGFGPPQLSPTRKYPQSMSNDQASSHVTPQVGANNPQMHSQASQFSLPPFSHQPPTQPAGLLTPQSQSSSKVVLPPGLPTIKPPVMDSLHLSPHQLSGFNHPSSNPVNMAHNNRATVMSQPAPYLSMSLPSHPSMNISPSPQLSSALGPPPSSNNPNLSQAHHQSPNVTMSPQRGPYSALPSTTSHNSKNVGFGTGFQPSPGTASGGTTLNLQAIQEQQQAQIALKNANKQAAAGPVKPLPPSKSSGHRPGSMASQANLHQQIYKQQQMQMQAQAQQLQYAQQQQPSTIAKQQQVAGGGTFVQKPNSNPGGYGQPYSSPTTGGSKSEGQGPFAQPATLPGFAAGGGGYGGGGQTSGMGQGQRQGGEDGAQ